jgi:hypothetical protein
MPGAGLAHGPPADKKQAAVTTGSAEHPAFPARWAYGLYVISPGTGLIAPVAHKTRHIFELGISTGMPGPHDFTVRSSSVVAQKRLMYRGHRIPASHIVTIARTPLCLRRDDTDETPDLGVESRNFP